MTTVSPSRPARTSFTASSTPLRKAVIARDVVTPGADHRANVLAGHGVFPPPGRLLERSERSRDGDLTGTDDRLGLRRVHGSAERGHPFDRLVAKIPDEAKGSAGFEHAPCLSARGIHVNPMPRLPKGHSGDARILERQVLRRSAQCGDSRHGAVERGEHPWIWVHRDYVVALRKDRRGELPGARANVSHNTGDAREEPCHGVGQIAGTAPDIVPSRGPKTRSKAAHTTILGLALVLPAASCKYQEEPANEHERRGPRHEDRGRRARA